MNTLLYNKKAYAALAAYISGGRLPHAILLEGIGGSGKTTFAREIAMGALCTASLEERPCGVCRDCVKAEKDIHPDVITFSGDGGSRSFHVDLVRQLRQEAYVRANEGRCKVLVLKNVHHMSVQAENALLKIIEEPPKGVMFVLTCENKAMMLDTILSRVSLIELQAPALEQRVSALRELKPGLEDQRYRDAAAGSVSIGGGLALLEQESDASISGQAFTILEAVCLGSELDAMALLSGYEKDMPGFLDLLDKLGKAVRQLFGAVEPENGAANRLKARLTPLQLMQILAIIEEIAEAVPQNINKLLLVTNLSAKMKLMLSR